MEFNSYDLHRAIKSYKAGLRKTYKEMNIIRKLMVECGISRIQGDKQIEYEIKNLEYMLYIQVLNGTLNDVYKNQETFTILLHHGLNFQITQAINYGLKLTTEEGVFPTITMTQIERREELKYILMSTKVKRLNRKCALKRIPVEHYYLIYKMLY